MEAKAQRKFYKLISRYKGFLYAGIAVFLLCIITALVIFSFCTDDKSALYKFAEFLMAMAETMLGAGIIGGGIGGGINFIFEEIKREEEERKESQKIRLEKRQKSRLFRRTIRQALGEVHDDVGLARILIKSHKSGKTYGEQIRNRIMPSLVSLQDIRRDLAHVEDSAMLADLTTLRVSLNYMIAYLSVLTREFETSYLTISNLQNYQDTLDGRMRNIFTDLAAGSNVNSDEQVDNQALIDQAMHFFDETDVPDKINTVWQAIRKLNYVSDFIDELRDEKGAKSYYNLYFLKHYNHCIKMLRSSRSSTNKQLVEQPLFIANMEELLRIDEKRRSKDQLTNQDFLTWRMMEREMHFDIESGRKQAGK